MQLMSTTENALTRWLRGLRVMSPAERRESPRHPFAASIEVRTDGGTIFRGVARDLSVRGMGAIVYADLKVGDCVVVHYAHPMRTAPDFVRRTAYVRGRYGSRYGFEFDQPLPS